MHGARTPGDLVTAGTAPGGMMGGMREDLPVPGLDTGRPDIARVCEYWLGGKDYFAAGRELAGAVGAADVGGAGPCGRVPVRPGLLLGDALDDEQGGCDARDHRQ